LRYGGRRAKSIQDSARAQKKGTSLFPTAKGYEGKPARVPARPTIPGFFELHWNCFQDGVFSHPEGNVPMSHVRDYCDFYGIRDGCVREDVHRLVRLLSAEYQRHLTARRKDAERKAKSKSKGPGKGARTARPRTRKR
jgi:hypothetical protein